MKRLLHLSFFLILSISAVAQDYVTLYADCDYSGPAAKLYPGTYSLSSTNVGRGKLSSLRVPYGFKVVIYANAEPGNGPKTRFTSDVNCLPSDWNDKAGSVVVERENSSNNNSGGNYGNSGGSYNGSGVVAFADCNLRGGNRTFGPGAYNTDQLAGVGNDRISSIQVPSGWQVIVYADDNWGGASRTYYSTVTCLENSWNDRISSLRIYSNTGNQGNWNPSSNNNSGYEDYPSRNDGITLFEDCYYAGRHSVLRPGRYDSREMGIANDRISSIKIPSGFSVTVYGDGGFNGGRRYFTRDVNCLASDWNDKISSIEVSRGSGNEYDQNHASNYGNENIGVTFYERSWFMGHSRSFGTGSYNFDGNDNLDRNASSIKIETGYTLTVWDEPGYRGNRRVFTGSSGNLNLDGWNDKIRSFSIRRNY